jgi:membrane-associated PAP2 superfamily phosphatase
MIADWVVPALVLGAATAWLRSGDIDLAVSARFYSPGAGWPVGGEPPWNWLYHYGVAPAWIMAVPALFVGVAAAFRTGLRRYRRAAWFLVLAMTIGPGLLVNTVFKQNWGRPRPRDVVQLGGEREFLPVWKKGPSPDWGNAFASGHTATAFYIAAPFFLLRRRRRGRALAWLAAGVAYGALMGTARIAQGAHFLSDVVWAGGFVWLTCLALYYALGLYRREACFPLVVPCRPDSG